MYYNNKRRGEVLLLTINKTLQTRQEMEIEECNQEWINFLCNYGNRLEYQQIASKSKNDMFAIMEYRRLLRGRDLGNIPLIALNTAYIQINYNRLRNLLQELFLEIISEEQFNFILEKLNSIEDGIKKLYDRHMQDRNKRILNVVLIL